MSFYLEKSGKNIWHGKFSSFSSSLLVHGISTRFGGTSQPPFAAMNLALHVGDDSAAVCQNRQIFCESLGVSAESLCTPEQVHGEYIARVTRKDAGRGSKVYADALPQTDALITNEADIPLMLCFADCTPILFFDAQHHAIGMAHGGWRGTIKKIAQKTLLAMQREFGTCPADCLVGIGPSIGPCCYEVGDNVAQQFCDVFPKYRDVIVRENDHHIHLDLWAANQLQLEEVGVLPSHIDKADACTVCNPKVFFSYRAEKGKTGRIGAIISLRQHE